jgi:hypothetical protein
VARRAYPAGCVLLGLPPCPDSLRAFPHGLIRVDAMRGWD